MKVFIGPYNDDSEEDRQISVEIDDYDTWNMDSTLAFIILPMLKQLQETKQGSPNVDDEDVPDYLKSTSAPLKENEWDTDDNWHQRWDWVLNEMIWSFQQQLIDWEDQYHLEGGEWHLGSPDEDNCRELIWDKEPVINMEGLKTHGKRMQNGFRLFGKYYTSLWD